MTAQPMFGWIISVMDQLFFGRELRIGWNFSGIDEGDNYCHPRRQSLSFKML